MCITSKSLAHVFGNRVSTDGCTVLEEEGVRICVCNSPLCNQEPIYQQVYIFLVVTCIFSLSCPNRN